MPHSHEATAGDKPDRGFHGAPLLENATQKCQKTPSHGVSTRCQGAVEVLHAAHADGFGSQAAGRLGQAK